MAARQLENEWVLYLFDVEGTLRRPLLWPHIASLATWDQRILPGRPERLAALRRDGHRLGAASNQGAIAFGLLSQGRAERILDETNHRLGDVLEWTRICPHHPAGLRSRYRVRCACRKPATGMLEEALAYFGVPASEAVYVGDRETDRQAALAAGFRFVAADQFFG